jgi:hypothetical protein
MNAKKSDRRKIVYPQGFLHQILSLARLPIPPPVQGILDFGFTISMLDLLWRMRRAALNTALCGEIHRKAAEPMSALVMFAGYRS